MKGALITTNFTAGEFAPSLSGRVDVAKYGNAVARLENFFPRVQGGAVGRDGSRLLGYAKQQARLIPFVFSRAVSYQIEFGANYLRIWRSDGTRIGGPLELATPYGALEFPLVKYEQADDTMFFFLATQVPRRLQRLNDTTWRLDPVPFAVLPFSERSRPVNTTGTLSAATVGTGRTLTAGAATFYESDVGRDVVSGFGAATITGYTSATVVTVTVTSAFTSPNLASGAWALEGSPFGFMYPGAKEPVGQIVTLFGAITRPGAININLGTSNIQSTPGIFVAGDVGKRVYGDLGVYLITAFNSATSVDATRVSTALPLTDSYTAGSWGITGDVFRASDVGAYVRAPGTGGLWRITKYIDPTKVEAEIRSVPSSHIANLPGAWEIATADWTTATGYPACGALHEQRLWLANTTAQPQGIWASRIGEYLNFEPGVDDDDGFSYVLNTHQRNPITHLAATKRLFALTAGLEASLRGGNEKAIGPTNIRKDNESTHGCNDVRPVVVGREVLFIHGAGRALHAMGYNAAIDGFDSPDRTIYADHILQSGVVDMAHQAKPDSLIHCVRADGQMAVCAYNVEQEVVGWSRYLTQGFYRSVSVVPVAARDDVWTIVERVIAGVTVFCVERFEPGLKTDCTVTQSSGMPIDTWAVNTFDGMEVATKADGVYMGTVTATAGNVVLPRPASVLEAGLPFVPELELLPPEVAGGSGTAQGSNMSVHEVVVRLLDTNAIEINGEQGDFRQFGSNLLDRPPPGYTGDYRAITLSDSLYRPKLVIRQPFPYPIHVTAVVRKLTVNDT